MSMKVAINGMGRIGRAVLKLVLEEPSLELVAINDLMDVDNLAYLLRFDTVYGRYDKSVVIDDGDLVVAGRKLHTLGNRDPATLPWKAHGVDLVFELVQAALEIGGHVLPAGRPLEQHAEVADTASERIAQLDVFTETAAALQGFLGLGLILPEVGRGDAGFERGEFVGTGSPVKDSSGDRQLV